MGIGEMLDDEMQKSWPHDLLFVKLDAILSYYCHSDKRSCVRMASFIENLSDEDLYYCLNLDRQSLEEIILPHLELFCFEVGTVNYYYEDKHRIREFVEIINEHRQSQG